MGPRLLALLPREENVGITAQQLFGPVYFGIIFNFFSVGDTGGTEAYAKTDVIWMQAGVGLLVFFDTAQSVITSQEGWRFMVDGWSTNDIDSVLQSPGWGAYALPLTDALTISIVFFFYAQKIWSLFDRPQNLFYAAVVVALSILQLIGGIGCAAIAAAKHSSLQEFSRNRTWSCIWLVTATVADILIAILLSLKLSKSRTGYKPPDEIVGKIIRGSVETGLATTVVQFMTLVVYLAWTSKPAFIFFGFILPKIYSNSMLAILNARQERTSTYTGLIVGSLQDRPVGEIRVHTTQTVDVSSDYEVSRRAKRDSKQRMREEPFAVMPDPVVPFAPQRKDSL